MTPEQKIKLDALRSRGFGLPAARDLANIMDAIRQRRFGFMADPVSLAHCFAFVTLREARRIAWQEQEWDSWLWKAFEATGEFGISTPNALDPSWDPLFASWRR